MGQVKIVQCDFVTGALLLEKNWILHLWFLSHSVQYQGILLKYLGQPCFLEEKLTTMLRSFYEKKIKHLAMDWVNIVNLRVCDLLLPGRYQDKMTLLSDMFEFYVVWYDFVKFWTSYFFLEFSNSLWNVYLGYWSSYEGCLEDFWWFSNMSWTVY